MIFANCTFTYAAGTNDITTLVQRGLFEEEANHNLDAAMQSYETAIKLHDKDRKLAATAIFRLGECYRKQGKTDEANAQYKRIVTEFPDQKELVDLSRGYLPKATNNFQTQLTKIVTDANGSDLEKQYRELAAETAKAEALWKHVNGLGGEDLVKFFTTIQPDQIVIDLDNARANAKTKLPSLATQFGAEHPEYKAQENVAKLNTERLYERAHTVAWGLEQKYKMLKEQEDALKARLAETSAPVAKSNEPTTTSEEDEEIRKIKDMIRNSPDLINTRAESSGLTPLQSAASTGHLKVAQYLVESGAQINPSGMTPLMYAAQNGHNAMVEFLLSKGAEVNAATDEHMTALHYAAQHGFKVVVETLLKHGADVNARGKGRTAIWYAADIGSKPILELLIAKGGDVNTSANDSGGPDSSPLLQAVKQKHADCVEVLLAHKADVNFTDSRGNTPLLTAADNDDLETARILLEHGANTEAQIPTYSMDSERRYVSNWSQAGLRAINFAIRKDDPKFVELLLEHHANPNSTCTYYDGPNVALHGATPLIMAVHSSRQAIVEVLLNHGADVNGTDDKGATALHYSVFNSKTNLAAILLQHDANINAFDKNHQTPIFYAINLRNPSTNMIALLIAHHADVNVTDLYGYTPIYHVMSEPPGTLLGTIREQLRKAGASENVVRLKQISLRQNGGESVVFTKGSNDWNHFTLLELISVVYGRNEPPDIYPVSGNAPADPLRSIPNRGPRPGIPGFAPAAPGAGGVIIGGVSPTRNWQRPNFQFPDFAHIVIKRISQSQFKHNNDRLSGFNGNRSGEETVLTTDVIKILESSDPDGDWQLDWGDIVEIPEIDHPVNATWPGISSQTQQELMEFLARSTKITVKGTTTNIEVLPPMADFSSTTSWQRHLRITHGPDAAKSRDNTIISPFGLRSIINEANVLLSSSDTSHIKILRGPSGLRTLTVDLYRDPEPWVERGDAIEIPDRDTDASQSNPSSQ